MSYNMFIDDERYPPNDGRMWVICRNKIDVDWYVSTQGMPNFISFDHDLGKDQPTGYDIAKDLCMGYDAIAFRNFPDNFDYYVHSQNPVGKRNIKCYMDNYLAFIKDVE